MSRIGFWLNILAMFILVCIVIFLTLRWIDRYTQHGMAIQVPDITNLDESEAIRSLQTHDLQGATSDRTYVKGLPEGIVVAQHPSANAKVKRGRTIYLTISSGQEPMISLPDVADNSSYRQAASQLRAAGFTLTSNDTIRGEADWVYKVLYQGKETKSGQLVPEGATLTLVIGDGTGSTQPMEEAEIEDGWF